MGNDTVSSGPDARLDAAIRANDLPDATALLRSGVDGNCRGLEGLPP